MKKLLVCLAVTTVLFTGCTFGKKAEGIIKVNDQVITQAEFDKAFDKSVDSSVFKSFGGSKNFVKSDENPMYNIFKDKVVNELIVKSVLEAEIEKRNIKATKEDTQEALKAIIDKVGSKEELNRVLKERGISNNDFMKDIEIEVKIKKLVKSLENTEVTDADTKQYYDTHINEFKHGDKVRASHILISADTIDIIKQLKEKNPNMTPEQLNTEVEKQLQAQKEKAEAVLAAVKKNPADFEKIAKQKSDDKASAERGGELGFFTRETMVKEFSDAAFSMKPNTISELVKTNFGYHIIKVTDRVEAGTQPYDKVKNDIKYYMETQKQLEVLKKLTAELLNNAKIEYLNPEFNPAKSVKVNEEAPKEEKNK